MLNLFDAHNVDTQPIAIITDDTIRYTTVDAAVQAMIRAYRASIDTRAGFDKPWPMNSEVIGFVIEAPTRGHKMRQLRRKVAEALEPFIPVKSVEITAEYIKVRADLSSDRAPSTISPEVRRRSRG